MIDSKLFLYLREKHRKTETVTLHGNMFVGLVFGFFLLLFSSFFNLLLLTKYICVWIQKHSDLFT